MWNGIDEELCQVDRYFYSETFVTQNVIEKFQHRIKNLVRVGPLRNFSPFISLKSNVKKRVLINFGGGDSYLSDFCLVVEFYALLISIIFECFSNQIIEMCICGGNHIIHSLREYRLPKTDFDMKYCSLGEKEYMEYLYNSEYIILSPGLGNFFESISTDKKLMMIPPINYSQFLQLEKFKNLSIGIYGMNWSDFYFYNPIKEYLKEEDGVNQVLNHINLFMEHTYSQQQFKVLVQEFINGNNKEFLQNRQEFYNSISKNGVNKVAGIIKEDLC